LLVACRLSLVACCFFVQTINIYKKSIQFFKSITNTQQIILILQASSLAIQIMVLFLVFFDWSMLKE
jgi:hypothetical protein